MPFMNAPPGSYASSTGSIIYGSIIKALRNITQRKLNREPEWRHNRNELTTGYKPKHYAKSQ